MKNLVLFHLLLVISLLRPQIVFSDTAFLAGILQRKSHHVVSNNYYHQGYGHQSTINNQRTSQIDMSNIVGSTSRRKHPNQQLFAKLEQGDDKADQVQVGTKEYYSGFISRDINEEPEERVTGDAVLIPTLKFVGGFAAILGVLFFAFLVSNDLL